VPVRPHVLPLALVASANPTATLRVILLLRLSVTFGVSHDGTSAEPAEVDFRVIRSHTWYDNIMKQKEKELPEGDSRVTIRVAPEYRTHLQLAALEMGVNQSILVRNAIQEYVERHKQDISPELFARFEHFRQNRERPGML
jgi:hypothetical protein